MNLTATAAIGAICVVIYTLVIAGADGITKHFAGAYAAPQLFCLSAGLVLLLCFGANMVKPHETHFLVTRFKGAMLLRSILTVVSAVCFFQAFRLLPFADVFLFMGLVPVMAAVMSGPILGEHIRPQAWIALGIGVTGILFLMPNGPTSAQSGHFWAIGATTTGTASMVLARFIGRDEQNYLAQVFYPNLAIFITMAIALPFVWRPMEMTDVAFVALYALALFVARWLSVVALRLLPAYVATPLMNLQFVWMVLIGFVFFSELPSIATVIGVALVMMSAIWLVLSESSDRDIMDTSTA